MNRRPLVLALLSFSSGIVLAEILGVNSTPAWAIWGILSALAVLLIAEGFKSEFATGAAILGIACLGLALYGGQYFNPKDLYSRIDSLNSISGQVVSYPIKSSEGAEFTLNPTNHRGKFKVFLSDGNSAKLDYGDRLTVKGKFQVPGRFGGFNYREFLRRKNIWGVVYQGKLVKRSRGFANPVLELGWQLRKNISVRIDRVLPEQGHFLKALLFGSRKVLSDDTEESFTRTGLAHLLAASGLHLGIILGASWWISTSLGFGRGTTYLASLPLVLLYLMIVGFELPMMRASLIYVFAGIHIWLKKVGLILEDWYDRYQALAGAALVLLLLNPESLSTVGFQLSFGATFALALLFEPIKELLPTRPKYLNGIMAASLSAQLGVSPVLATHFGQIHPWAPVINLAAIPGVTAILYLGIIALILGRGIPIFSFLGPLTGNAILVFRRATEKIASVPLVKVGLNRPSNLALASYFILLYWFKRKLSERRVLNHSPNERVKELNSLQKHN